MRTKYNIISYTALIFLGLFVLITTALYTNTGLRWTIKIASAVIPGQLSVSNAQGQLAKQINIASFSYRKDSLKISAHNIHLTWQLWDLLDNKLTIKKLHADQINVQLPTTTTNKKPAIKKIYFPNAEEYI